ncbi:hypothetical protein L218DRAFT_491612 [Marasmius fiardii PR-910]|nr:hypothetical protein L218DRAFT_491612 [Marasmius fiardii PR-910]
MDAGRCCAAVGGVHAWLSLGLSLRLNVEAMLTIQILQLYSKMKMNHGLVPSHRKLISESLSGKTCTVSTSLIL